MKLLKALLDAGKIKLQQIEIAIRIKLIELRIKALALLVKLEALVKKVLGK